MTTPFLFNPYDATLDLTDKDDRKLYQEACKGLSKDDRFDGKRENYPNFVKLLEQQLQDVRVMETLEVPTAWDSSATNPDDQRLPIQTDVVDIFKSHKATSEQVEHYCDLVWANTAHASTPEYFAHFDNPPTDDAALTLLRNTRRLKHIILGKKLWNSLTSSFQIDIQVNRDEFQRNRECDGPLLWDFIRRRVNPSTSVGASRLKEKLESTTLEDMDHDVVRYNSWFEDMRVMITKEEGEGYSEYLRAMFRAYLSSGNQKFLDAIQAEERDWMQGKVRSGYGYRDLMSLGRLTYNNLLEKGAWTSQKPDEKEDPGAKYLALATELVRTLGNSRNKDDGDKDSNGRGKLDKGWRYHNPDDLKEKKIGGRLMKWCSSDCHQKPQWCGRRNCLNNADYAEAMNKRKEKNPSNNEGGVKATKDFKIALAALTTKEDFEALEKQFFSVKE